MLAESRIAETGDGRAMAGKRAKKLNVYEVIAIGIGGMIGGGIFAVLGLAIAAAGHAVALTLAVAGCIALVTGLSYAHLGLAFRGDGGSYTYIEKAFPSPLVGVVSGWLLVGGYVGTLALYATAFGYYGALLLGGNGSRLWAAGLACAGLLLFLGINLLGAKLSGSVELGVVGTKLAILTLFAGVGMVGMHRSHFVPVFDQGWMAPVAAVALIFVAYEGFELIPNAVDEMDNPEKHLRPAILIAIAVTTVIYVLVAIAALGNLTPAQIKNDQEYVLAVAAEPKLGHAGFVLIGIAALLSTSSAINATLFGAGRLAMVMAKGRALPAVLGRLREGRPVPWVAILALTILSLGLTLGARLGAISFFASATFLLIFCLVNAAAWRLAGQISLHPVLPATGAIVTGTSFLVLLWNTWQGNRGSLYWLLSFYAVAICLGFWKRALATNSPDGSVTRT